MITLMLLALLLVGASVSLLRELRRDGYGDRPLPRSRYDELDPRFDLRLP